MVLLIDNYDSFTWNLAHRLGELGAVVRVVRNDAITIAEIERLAPDHIVISPGPGRPESAGVSIVVIRRFGPQVPILGVCLGHQAIAIAHGGRVGRAAEPRHGKMSLVAHEGTHLFAGLTSPIEAGRYHSLVIPPDAMPPGFILAASIEREGTVMAIRHEMWPLFGVQFHPESVMTPVGHRILQNFLECHVH
jgi:anthranilate synthase/aminodeoxychorismate synthase-like glutamine amidotransferase